MTSSYRQNRTRLFYLSKAIRISRKLRWISYTIKLAYRKCSNRDISFLKTKTHEVRALSSSWAFFDKVPLDEILKAAVWNHSSTFAKFYLRDMSQQAANLQSLYIQAHKIPLQSDVPVYKMSALVPSRVPRYQTESAPVETFKNC